MAFENLKSTGIAYLLTKLKGVFVQIKDSVRSVNYEKPDEYGNIDLNTVPFAQNLESSSVKRNYESFALRTTGGSSSIETGKAYLMALHGSNVHDDYVPEEIVMTVTSETITATLNRDTFVNTVSASGTTTLTYTTSWSANPANYGITVTGTPANGDTIEVDYTKEERGTITNSNPQSFVSTGWNLYDHTNGIARVVDYAYGYKIAGTYLALQYSATLTGTKSDITVTSGAFSVPGDGYVWVTGGNNTDTAIWATWEDWTTTYDGSFAPYTESEIDLSTIMGTYFPYGLLKAGGAYDEIDLNMGKAISRVERMAYTSSNLATAKSSGRDYEYDENYIYLARAVWVENDISLDGEYAADDHGLEWFAGSDIDVTAEFMYGQNLRNKLERDVLTISQQSLTTTQKEQVNANIGSVPKKIPVYNGDLNDITETGIVYATSSTTNCPYPWSIVETLVYDNNAMTQTATSVVNSKHYVRTKSNAISTTWSAWQLVHYGKSYDLGTETSFDTFKSDLTAVTDTMNTKEERCVGFGCQFASGLTNGFKNGVTYQGTLRIVSKTTNSLYYTVLFEGAATSSVLPVYVMYNNSTFNIYPAISRSLTFSPSAGDSLLTWLNANVNVDTLPFSFVKSGFNDCSDTPSGLSTKEFAGIVFGNGQRWKIMVHTYGGSGVIDYERDVWEGEFNGSWRSMNEKIDGLLGDAIVIEEYSYTYNNLAQGSYLGISASDFGITAKSGYTCAAVVSSYTGSYNAFIYRLIPRTTSTVMSIRNMGSADITSESTATVKIMWIRNDLL